jgi:hypothetical protein
LLVQPALSNHPELQLGPNADLAPARLITGLSTDGQAVPIFGHLYRFTEQKSVRRVALIDVASGRLIWEPVVDGSAVNPLDQQLGNPFNNGCSILPDWSVALRHAMVAHQVCSNFAFIGWDIAFTEEGPMLLEGNANWCADEYQRLREPLARTKFAEILSARLRELAPRV